MTRQHNIHGSAVSYQGKTLVILGAPGAGKSQLALRLIADGATLIADDQLLLSQDGLIRAPDETAGLIELRGLGLLRFPYAEAARIDGIVCLDDTLPDTMRDFSRLNGSSPDLNAIQAFAATL